MDEADGVLHTCCAASAKHSHTRPQLSTGAPTATNRHCQSGDSNIARLAQPKQQQHALAA